jgi:hypothetical protein
MTVAVPAPTVERLPGPRTAATDAGVTDQLTELVTSAELPSLNVPVAV